MDKKVLYFAFISAFLVPRDLRVGLFHVSFLFFVISIVLHIAHKKVSLFQYFTLLVLAGWPLIGALSSLVHGYPVSTASVRSFFPLFTVYCTYIILKNNPYSKIEVYRAILVFSSTLALFVILQVVLQVDIIREIWASQDRIDAVFSESFVLAPTGNPNNSALLFGLGILSVLWALKTQMHSEGSSGSIYTRLLESKLIVVSICTILFVGIIFAYARTVIVSIILSIILLLLIYAINSIDNAESLMYAFVSLVCVSYVIIVNISNPGEIGEYYLTVFKLFEARSIQERMEAWVLGYELLVSNPVLLFTGVGEYESLFISMIGNSILDSGVLYIILSYGALFTSVLIFYILKTIYHHRSITPIFSYLLITSLTLPFISDYILCISISYITSLIIISEKYQAMYE